MDLQIYYITVLSNLILDLDSLLELILEFLDWRVRIARHGISLKGFLEFLLQLDLANLPHSLCQIILHDIIPLLLNSQHLCVGNHIPQISATEILTQLDESRVINLPLFIDSRGIDFEDFETAYFVGEGDFNFAIQTAGTEEGGVEGVGTIFCGDDCCLAYELWELPPKMRGGEDGPK